VVGKSNIHSHEMSDLGTNSPILGKPKFITLADEISSLNTRTLSLHRGCLNCPKF
jgi:hypothetical protein